MAELVSKDVKLYVGEYDLSGSHNQASLNYNAEMLETTGFGNDSRKRKAGLTDIEASLQGFFDAGVGTVDAVYSTNIGVSDVPMAICPTTGAQGERAFIFKSVQGDYNPITGSVGEILMFNVSANGSSGWPLVSGTVMETGTFAATADGTGVELGAVGADEHLYISLHVLSGSSAFDVDIESDVDNVWSTPTIQHSMTQATGATSESVRVAGPITDTWWRASWTVTGSFVAVIIVGIK